MPFESMLFLGCVVVTFGLVGGAIYYAQRQTEAVQRAARLTQAPADTQCINAACTNDTCSHKPCSDASRDHNTTLATAG